MKIRGLPARKGESTQRTLIPVWTLPLRHTPTAVLPSLTIRRDSHTLANTLTLSRLTCRNVVKSHLASSPPVFLSLVPRFDRSDNTRTIPSFYNGWGYLYSWPHPSWCSRSKVNLHVQNCFLWLCGGISSLAPIPLTGTARLLPPEP